MHLPAKSRIILDDQIHYYDGSKLYKTREDYEKKSDGVVFSGIGCHRGNYIGPIDFTLTLDQRVLWFKDEKTRVRGIVDAVLKDGSVRIHTKKETIILPKEQVDHISAEATSTAEVVITNKAIKQVEGFHSRETTAMALLAFRKRQRRIAKGQIAPYLFHLNWSSHAILLSETKLDSFTPFLNQLKKNLDAFPEGARFQLIVNAASHYAVIDLQKKAGKIRSLTFSAADHPLFKEVHKRLTVIFPERDHDHYRFLSEGGHRRKGLLQSTGFGCNVFAMEHASKLSKIDGDELYDALATCSDRFKEFSLSSLTSSTAGVVFAPLLASMQSLSRVDAFPERISRAKVGKRGEALEDYVSARRGYIDGKAVSDVIKRKSDKLIARVEAEYAELTDRQFQAVQYFTTSDFFLRHPRLLEVCSSADEMDLAIARLRAIVFYIDDFGTVADKEHNKIVKNLLNGYLVSSNKVLAFYELVYEVINRHFSPEISLLVAVATQQSSVEREILTAVVTKQERITKNLVAVCDLILAYSKNWVINKLLMQLKKSLQLHPKIREDQDKILNFLGLIHRVKIIAGKATPEVNSMLANALQPNDLVHGVCARLTLFELPLLVNKLKTLISKMPRECSRLGFFGVASRHSGVHDEMKAFIDAIPLEDLSSEQEVFYKQLVINKLNYYHAGLAKSAGRSATLLTAFLERAEVVEPSLMSDSVEQCLATSGVVRVCAPGG